MTVNRMSTESNALIEKIQAITEQVAIQAGCRLYDLEFGSIGGNRTLRVYIDKDIEGGPTLDDCASVSRGLNAILDQQEDIVPGGHYTLEVSTPGIERPLKKSWHYQAVAGKKIWMKLDKSLQALGLKNPNMAAHKQLEIVVQGSDDNGVRLQIENEEILIPYASIEKARVVFEFGAAKGKKKNQK
jgi:ribosome maturation factor RimP